MIAVQGSGMLLGAKEAPATMRNEDIERRDTRRGGSFWPVAGAIALGVVLSGCSSVPDPVNPVKWYTNTVDYFSGDEDAKEPAKGNDKAVPGADQPFPNLATVPAKPEVSSAEERNRIAQGLVSDSERRRYAQDVARQGAPTNVLGSESSAPAPSTAGAPAALPPLPATQAQAPQPPATAAPAAPSAPAARAPAPLMPSAPPQSAASAPPPPQLSAAPPAPSAPAMPPATGVASRSNRLPASAEPFETVVVSSSGVDASADVSAPPRAGGGALAAREDRVPDAGRSRGSSIQVATIQFANASSDLDSRDRTILRNVVALQRERGGIIRVVGHASHRTANMDPVSHKLVNYDISSERAEMVAKTLAELGARTQDIVVVAKADVEPLYYEVMPAGEAGNRRTEVYLDF